MSADPKELFQHAAEVIKENDKGTYTVPVHGLYPFQWNWDSCLSAIGMQHSDEVRAWQEIETLLDHQWPDGMVPHIIFHEIDEGYFPGPDVWQTNRPTPTSGITQPAVLGFAMRRLYERAKDKAFVEENIRSLLPKAVKWHEWFYANRDPDGEGLVAVLHPWETGRDNSIDWDDAFTRVPTDDVAPYSRKDTTHVDAAERPTKEQYDRYIWLVQKFRSLEWDNSKLHDASPFKVVDPGFNAILIRSDEDIAWLAEEFGEDAIAQAAHARVTKARNAFPKLWNEEAGQYVCYDRAIGKQVESLSVGGLLPVFAGCGHEAEIADRITKLRAQGKYAVASHDSLDPRFDSKRYWRGPIWLIVNYMISDGLKRAGYDDVAKVVIDDSLALIKEGSFAEYYDHVTGDGYGGDRFTWTAAMVKEFLYQEGEV